MNILNLWQVLPSETFGAPDPNIKKAKITSFDRSAPFISIASNQKSKAKTIIFSKKIDLENLSLKQFSTLLAQTEFVQQFDQPILNIKFHNFSREVENA